MKKSLFEEMGGTYRQEGDYLLPNLSVPELPPLGVWGQRHLRYIKEHRPARYNALLLGGKLNGYLTDIDEQAQERLDTIIRQMAEAQGFHGGNRGDTEWSQWVRSEKEQLALVMERHGIEWEDKGTHDKHLSVLDYKKEQRAKEVAALETVMAEKESQVEGQERRLKELAPAVKNMERLAAEFSADPEQILPEPGALETGRAYRERKAKPLWEKIVNAS